MTERLYYNDSFLYEFDATIEVLHEENSRLAVVLDRTAFYPTSGGQTFDTGSLLVRGRKFRVVEVAENDNGEILHFLEPEGSGDLLGQSKMGEPVRGIIDQERRRDHVQQHSGQHVLSAAFVHLFQLPTVSFHMGDESCTIDLQTGALNEEQMKSAEDLANTIVMENRPVEIHFATEEQARTMGARKFVSGEREKLRLVDFRDFDLTGCGGTHVRSTGQIGPILLRKAEKVKQGVRVEFVCGDRAIRTVRRDHAVLVEAAGLYSTHIWELPQQARRSLEESKTSQREKKRLLEEIAGLYGEKLRAKASSLGTGRVVCQVFTDRDAEFIKLVARSIIAAPFDDGGSFVVALLGAAAGPQPALVFGQSTGGPCDMGKLMKEATAKLGGRGGGNKDMAQGGATQGADLEKAIAEAVASLGQST